MNNIQSIDAISAAAPHEHSKQETKNYTVNLCPSTNFESGLQPLSEMQDNGVNWLEAQSTKHSETKWNVRFIFNLVAGLVYW